MSQGPPEKAHDNPWKLALESSGEGVWDWDVVTGEQTHSRQWKEMLGYAEHEVGTGYHEFADRVHPDDIARATPVFEHFPGWTSLAGVRTWDDLPEAARAYVESIQARAGVPFYLISVGADRAETIALHDPFAPR